MNGGLKLIFGIAVGIGLVGLTSSLAWADESPGYRGGGGHAFGMTRHDIGLTDEQTAKLKALALDQDRAQIRAHADVLVAERELRALVWNEKTDLSIIQAKLKEREALDANLRFMGIKAKRDLFAVLTPEQRDKLKAIREQTRDSHRARTSRSEGLAKTDHEETAEGMAPRREAEPRGTGGVLQGS